jgi:universal stress protein E
MLPAMKIPRAILVGVDFEAEGTQLTAGCRTAAREALEIARESGAKVTLLHSTTRDEYWDPLKRGLVIVNEGLPDEGREALSTLADEFRAQGTSCEERLPEEKPFLAIARAVVEEAIDLVVVGKHNSQEPDGRRLGSVTRRVLHYCPCPVLIVKPDAGRFRRILSATDLTPVGRLATRTAAAFAARHGAELHIAHAFRFPLQAQIEPGTESGAAYESQQQELAAAARAAVLEELEGTAMMDKAELHVGLDAPERMIRGLVEKLRPDLLVMGTVSRKGIAGFLMGNTAERLLERVDCSILAVKPEDFESPLRL